MAITTQERKEALADAAEQELKGLEARGVRMAGNAFSPVVLVKGELNDAERSGEPLLSGADGTALRAALGAIGWEPQDLCVLAAVAGSGDEAVAGGLMAGEPLPVDLFREALEALDPEAVILLDDAAADLLRETYADALAIVEDFDTAMLKPGLIAPVLGRRVLALDGFEAALSQPAEKQRMWAYLKQMPPLGAPY
ncbi:hypothetical protein [Collinsella intestinalis]|uniref:Uncharacterized protein n=1 Tax=Collinsella intestinalis TaxID=147207 RepID=A0A414NDN9_9ACTN|nr:hypothetical protein [Collinsella intestinalis]RHF37194.1 hypothetical protein DW682_06150 [Collinsella intestinalis]